jgi:hypothetical protein
VYVAYQHRLGTAACGLLAFLVNGQVSQSSGIKGTMQRRADGGVIQFRDQAFCTTCRRRLSTPLPLPEGRSEVDV